MTHHLAESQTPFDHQPPTIPPQGIESGSVTPPHPDPIRIYVACLAAYNNGHLHGRWIEVTDEAAVWEAVQAMLAASPIEEDAEEWAIHDYEGFEGAKVSEYASFETVVELAEYITERGELGAQVLNYYGGSIEDAKERFNEFAGEYESLEAFAQATTKSSGPDIPESLAPYIDYTRMAHDFEMSGDFLTFEVSGSVHIFWAH